MSSTASRAAGVALRGLGRSFGTHTVLRDIELEIAPGEVIALVGPSGSGKSTLLRIIAGLDEPTEGEVVLDGRRMRGVDPRCAVVFQEPRLLPWRDLAGNVALGLPPTISRAEGEAEVRRGLEIVGLAGFQGHRPRQVSGGMAQRTALARALVRHPGVLLLDEPFAALDALTRLRMQDLLDEVQRAAGITVVLVTHDVDEALRLADRVVVLETTGGEKGFTIGSALEVSSDRPRDDTDPRLAELRLDLLERLGVARRATVKETLR